MFALDSVTDTRLSDSVTVAVKSLPCIRLSCHARAAQVGHFVTLHLLLLLVPREFEISLSAVGVTPADFRCMPDLCRCEDSTASGTNARKKLGVVSGELLGAEETDR